MASIGLNRREVVKQLRAAARLIERGQAEARAFTVQHQLRDDRFPVTSVRVAYAKKRGGK